MHCFALSIEHLSEHSFVKRFKGAREPLAGGRRLFDEIGITPLVKHDVVMEEVDDNAG